ncbi:hypothetical protein OE88DRAFT_1663879 [Heliocybe sulcata]|uniref:F-box domain-containing protein n=1 Tax=Heliocybe sulcata TaxID=5364 RepID=A0A5C3MUY5_9AGAM|nr:hypothetical protein OE88DRAFT_1663879 [Heliocybe sulcata]
MFSFACTDDGKTGCSLAAVSRYVRDGSRRVRFQSVCVENYDQLQKLCILLENLPAPDRNVRNLFLTGPTSPEAPNTDGLDRQASLRAIRAWKDRLHEQGKEASLFIARLVHAISSTLQLVCFFVPPESQIELHHISVSLPVLEEITLPDANILCPLTITEPVQLFPKLKRVHFAGPYVDHLDQVLRLLPQFGPSVTHVRITGLEQSRRDPRELQTTPQTALQKLEKCDGGRPERECARPPENLRDVVVQMGPEPCTGFRMFNPGFLPYELVRKRLEELSGARNQLKITMLAAQTNLDDYNLAAAKEMWLDRVNGGSGCWIL